jgi:hypothetical protein
MALLGLAFLSALGCAAKVRVPTAHGDVEIDSGLRIVAVCFGEDGKLREVKVYRQSRVFAGQNTVLGLGAGTIIGAAVGAPAPGAAVGAGTGLVTDLVAAARDLIGTGQDPTPSCAPELAPDLLPEEQPKPTARREPAPKPRPRTVPAIAWELPPLGPGFFTCGGRYPGEGCP